MPTVTAVIIEQKSELDGSMRWVVDYYWTDVEPLDRPSTGGIVCGSGARGRQYAERVKRAVDSQTAFENIKRTVDVNGKSYISASAKFYGRRLNSTLKAIGY